MKIRLSLLAFASLCFTASAADLTLLSDGKSSYQIVVPDNLPTPALTESVNQTARLIQTAFKANGAEVPVMTESKRDATKPSIYVGSTEFAKKQGIDTSALKDWSYVHKAVGPDLILAGRDHESRVAAEAKKSRRLEWDRVGTAKAVADFARQYMGVRFLYPEIPSYTMVDAAAKVDLLNSPALEYLPTKAMTVPGTLDVKKTPLLRVNTSHPAGGGFYDMAHNRFPRVEEQFGGHTWERAVPKEKYAQSHPEYFALINGQRLLSEGNGQYCISNPEVQELIYQDLAKQFDAGHDAVDLGQPDGFRECQCEKCKALFDTGDDWSEKIWILNRHVAERLAKSHPGKRVTMMSYILTAKPPKTFKKFPANTCIMLTGTNEEDIAPWRDIEVPEGFTGYVYNWCPNLGSRYTPMRTPHHVEIQAKRLAANRIQSLYRDGPGQLFGLEGPVYYTMGRMFDDPENNAAKTLVPEFCDAAFGKASPSMRSFYDQLFDSILLYSDYIGTRTSVWSYEPMEGGRKRKTVREPFRLLAFLYPPSLLAAMDADLTQAEKIADKAKIKTRLALVRTEFNYVRDLARVVHLYQAFQTQPDTATRDRLLDAIDARNAAILALYDKRGRAGHNDGWNYPFFPFSGHSAEHLRLAYDGYQEPFASTCLNWDTKAMRNAPVPGKKTLTVAKASGPVTMDSADWQRASGSDLTALPPMYRLPRKSTVQLLYDKENLYVRAECELEADVVLPYKATKRDRPLLDQESLDIYLAPQTGRDMFYRFTGGAHPQSQWDAAAGFITDVMDPRYGKDDVTWNGAWTNQSQVDAKTKRWHALFTIPFKTVGMEPPSAGTTWRGNFSRNHHTVLSRMDRYIWSSVIGNTSMDDRDLFGEIVFE